MKIWVVWQLSELSYLKKIIYIYIYIYRPSLFGFQTQWESFNFKRNKIMEAFVRTFISKYLRIIKVNLKLYIYLMFNFGFKIWISLEKFVWKSHQTSIGHRIHRSDSGDNSQQTFRLSIQMVHRFFNKSNKVNKINCTPANILFI